MNNDFIKQVIEILKFSNDDDITFNYKESHDEYINAGLTIQNKNGYALILPMRVIKD